MRREEIVISFMATINRSHALAKLCYRATQRFACSCLSGIPLKYHQEEATSH